MDPAGNFVVSWTSDGSDGTDTSGKSVQAQRFGVDGSPVGSQFQVNAFTTGDQGGGNSGGSSVSVSADGQFVVIWTSEGSFGTDTSETSVQGQWFGPDGSAAGGQFQVNTYTTGYQGGRTGSQYVFYGGTSVSIGADQSFVVVWDSDGSYGTDASGKSIQGQRFETYIFYDGFESGDTSAWSNSVP